jgi:hypothetical protein
MPTNKIVNAHDVLPPYLLRLVQDKLHGKGMLLYVSALQGGYAPPYNLQMVHEFTNRGWSASQIAAQLQITQRQVYRLRKAVREHPECLEAQTPALPSAGDNERVSRSIPPNTSLLTARSHDDHQDAVLHRQATSAYVTSPEASDDVLHVAQVPFAPIDRTDW